MPIVTTTSHKRPRRSAALPVAAAAIAVLCLAAGLLLREGRAPARPQSPAVSDTAGEPAPAGTTTSAAPAATTSPPSGGATSAASAAPTSPPQGGPTSSADAEPAGPATNAPHLLPPRKTQRPTGFSGGPAEQLIAMMADGNDRSGMPPMPVQSEETLLRDLMVALTNDIVVYEDDPPETVAFKERVADFKNQLAKIVQDGGSITNAMKEYESWVNENKALRDAVIREYRRLRKEASQEEADAYLAEANKELEAEGIETVNRGKERRRNRPAESSHEQ